MFGKKHEITIEALRENPWIVMTHKIPPNPTQTLLEFAAIAATYCRDSEFALMQMALDGRYAPSWWTPDDICPDAHEESEDWSLEAEKKREEIVAVYLKLYGERNDTRRRGR